MRKRADYDAIAPRYDGDRVRYGPTLDRTLAAWLERRATHGRARVLDVGCGTGAWLEAQAPLAAGGALALVGLDPSTGMLSRADARRIPSVVLLRGRAERLPFAAGSFGFVSTRFAFHHFDDLPGFLREASRVLEPGGTLSLVNVLPCEEPRCLVHERFPEARAIDGARFPTSAAVRAAIVRAGFGPPDVSAEAFRHEWPVREYLEHARGRTLSQLHLLPAAAFEAGLARLEALAAREPATVLVDEGRLHAFVALNGARP